MLTKKHLLVGYAIIITGIIIFPPFRFIFPNGSIKNLGYSLIFDPPLYGSYAGSPNVPLLLVEMLAASLVFGVLYLYVFFNEKTL